jgi:hypothetical protein
MNHLGTSQVLSLGKFKVYPQSTQSGHFGHMTRKTVNVLGTSCIRKTAETPIWKILNVIVMYWVGIAQEHCPFACSVFVMYRVRKLRFVPSVISSLVDICNYVFHPQIFLGDTLVTVGDCQSVPSTQTRV